MSISSRFPSYRQVVAAAGSTVSRFPLALLSALFGTVVMVLLVDRAGEPSEHPLIRLAMTAALGLPLFISLATLAERLFAEYPKRVLLQAAGLLLLVAYYFSLPDNPSAQESHIVRFLVLMLAVHSLVAFVPFIRGTQVQGFWQYNKSLFLRLLIGGLYTFVLFVGLSIALAAMDYLFGVDIKPQAYGKLAIIMIGMFNTWFFLAGVPENFAALNDETSYPKGLKIFTQFVLLPLVALYFVILISYEIKIIIEWELPKGWVSQLVLWYAVVGIFSLLLLHPLREMTENKWIKKFATLFFRTIVPLIVLLFFAIIVRLGDYGFTEPRYFVLALAVGLSVVTLYFLFTRTYDIRIVPIVLFVLALVSAWGPWSAFAVSERSQRDRLETILERNGVLVDGKIVSASEPISHEDQQEISSILSYLSSWHAPQSVTGYLTDSARLALDTVPVYSRPFEITRLIGFEYVHTWHPAREGAFFSFGVAESGAMPIHGFDYLIQLPALADAVSPVSRAFGDETIYVKLDTMSATLMFSLQETFEDSAHIALLPLADTIRGLKGQPARTWAQPPEAMSFDIVSVDFEGRLFVSNIYGEYADERIRVITLNGTLLIRKK